MQFRDSENAIRENATMLACFSHIWQKMAGFCTPTRVRGSLRAGLIPTLALAAIQTMGPTSSARASDLRFMDTGKRTTQPIGHYHYCRSHISDCSRISLVTSPMELSRERWDELVEVNFSVNSTVEPVSDLELYGREEYWAFPRVMGKGKLRGKKGDCEDYVLLKRKKLMQRGWPASNLLITVVRRPNGEGHAVLTARTDHGDFILDNLVDRISAWQATPYTYLKRQAANHTGYWVDIKDNHQPDHFLVSSDDDPIQVEISRKEETTSPAISAFTDTLR